MMEGKTTRRRGGLGQTTTGLLLMAVGIVLLLDQLEIIEFGSYLRYWPIVLILLGLVRLVAPRHERDIPGGASTLLWGMWFMACSLHWLGLTYGNSWPLIFVIMGVAMILKALLRGGGDEVAGDGKEVPHA